MKRLILAAIMSLSAAGAQPALGWDPYLGPPWAPEPPASWTPEPAPVAPSSGIYLVTDTWAGDTVTTAGAVTTYSTDTVHQTTGSYARILDIVGTGGSSAFDGAAFNGRASLTDGRSVAGTYYESYVLTDGGFVPVGVVFFQDDSEIARAMREAAARPAPAPSSPVAAVVLPGRRATGATGAITPIIDRERPLPSLPPRPRPSVLLQDRTVEVLRGRRTTVSLSGADVHGWRFLSGEAVALGALAGAPGEPFVARWDRLAPPNATWVIRFLIDYADGTSHELALRVAVRAPGLVE
jgi:hypothetical protein